MTPEFKRGDIAKYIGTGFSNYTGSLVTLESNLLTQKYRLPQGTIQIGPIYIIRFFDGFKSTGMFGNPLGATPDELKPIIDPDEQAIKTTEKELDKVV